MADSQRFVVCVDLKWLHVVLPKLERVLERSMMVCLLGLLRTERLAREMSAVTRVIDILKKEIQYTSCH